MSSEPILMSMVQAAPAGEPSGTAGLLVGILPWILIFVIFYVLMIRPQQRRVKEHQEMVKNVRRGDTVVTSGGIVGKVTKATDDPELEVEIADGVRVKLVRSMISEVRTRGEPVKS